MERINIMKECHHQMKTYKSRQPQIRFHQEVSPTAFCSLLQSHPLSQIHPGIQRCYQKVLDKTFSSDKKNQDLGRQPLQDPLSVHEIAIKHNRGHPSEINQCRRVVDVVLPRRVWVVVLDKVDAKSVGLVVNLLQAFKNCVTLNALIIV